MSDYCPPMTGTQLYQQLKAAGYDPQPVGQGPDITTKCGSMRVSLAGNHIGSLITPLGITPLERLFRRLPAEGVLTATPERPFRFELGAIDVPGQMNLVLMDWRFAIYVPSGVSAGDTRELEERRLSLQVGYDVLFTDSRMSNLVYELEPSPPSMATTTFASGSNAGVIPGDGISGVAQSTFDQLRAANTLGSQPSGLSTMPQRHRRQSQLAMPFTYLVTEYQRVNFQVSIFRPISIPVSFFEVEATGFLIGQNAIKDFIRSIRPCTTGSI